MDSKYKEDGDITVVIFFLIYYAKLMTPTAAFLPFIFLKFLFQRQSVFLIVLHGNQFLMCLPQQGSINMTQFHTSFPREKHVLCQFLIL